MTRDELVAAIERNTLLDENGNVLPLGRDQIATIAHHNAVMRVREHPGVTMTRAESIDLMRRRLRMYEPDVSQARIQWAADHFLACLKSLLSPPAGLERG